MSTNGMTTAIKLAAKEMGASSRGAQIFYTANNGNVLKAYIAESNHPTQNKIPAMTVWTIKAGKISKQGTVHAETLATLLRSLRNDIINFSERNSLKTIEEGVARLKELSDDKMVASEHGDFWLITTRHNQYTIRNEGDRIRVEMFGWTGGLLDTGTYSSVWQAVNDIYYSWSHGNINL